MRAFTPWGRWWALRPQAASSRRSGCGRSMRNCHPTSPCWRDSPPRMVSIRCGPPSASATATGSTMRHGVPCFNGISSGDGNRDSTSLPCRRPLPNSLASTTSPALKRPPPQGGRKFAQSTRPRYFGTRATMMRPRPRSGSRSSATVFSTTWCGSSRARS